MNRNNAIAKHGQVVQKHFMVTVRVDSCYTLRKSLTLCIQWCFLRFMSSKYISYEMGFGAFGNFSMFTDSFCVVSIQYVANTYMGAAL